MKTKTKTYQIELSEKDARLFELIVECYLDWDEKPLTPEQFLAQMVDDVLLTVRRSGSWEGSNMANLLSDRFSNFTDRFLDLGIDTGGL